MDDLDFTFLEQEQLHMFYCFCTLIQLLHTKHLNFANLFLTVVKNRKYLKVLKTILGMDNDYDTIQYFLQQVPSVTKSKHVVKVINQLHKSKQLMAR